MADVFVSYKAEDRRRVRSLVTALEKDGFSVWWDAHLGPGQEWREQIAHELDAAKCVVVAWSKTSVGPGGRFVRDEAGRALRRGVYVPVKLDDVQPPLGFGETQAVSLIGWSGNRSASQYRHFRSAVELAVRGEQPSSSITEAPTLTSRRGVLISGAAVGIAATGAGWVFLHRERLSPEAKQLLQEATKGVQDGGVEANANAIATLQQAVEIEPTSGAIWGMLALAYVQQSKVAPAKDRKELTARGLSAARRALTIRPGQPEALAALIGAMPVFRNWFAVEQACRKALTNNPRNPYLLLSLAGTLFQVGRHQESLAAIDLVLEHFATPIARIGRMTLLWNLGRLDEADAELKRAASLWPRHFAVWFTQVYYRAYTGNAAEALAFLADTSGRPVGIPEWNFDLVRSQVDAIANNDLAKIRSTEKQLEAAAHNSAGFAENAILFTAFTGLADDAFKIANGLYNNRGFDVAEAWFSPEQAIYVGQERNTYILFQQQMSKLRRDTRYQKLTREIGLEDYWTRTRSRDLVVS